MLGQHRNITGKISKNQTRIGSLREAARMLRENKCHGQSTFFSGVCKMVKDPLMGNLDDDQGLYSGTMTMAHI